MVKRGGRFSGEAFVVLQASHQLDFALQKNKTYMGKRYVEVFRAKKLVRSELTVPAILYQLLDGQASCSWSLICWAGSQTYAGLL